jgi:ERCC4-type nuclease
VWRELSWRELKVAKFLISPSEKALAQKLKDDAIVSTLPEEKGADILIPSSAGLYGAQRKEVPHDFILSVTDGRMTRATSLLPKDCKFAELLCEGRFRYWPDGRLIMPGRREPSRWTRKQIRGILFDIKYVKGITVEYTEDIDDTVNYLRWIQDSLSRGKHLGLYKRPHAEGAWYVPTCKDIWSWLLQSFPGVGPSTADAIISHFGTIPLRWTCTQAELERVPRLSRARAVEMIKAFTASTELPTVSGGPSFDDLRRLLG